MITYDPETKMFAESSIFLGLKRKGSWWINVYCHNLHGFDFEI
jgi:hypothetical protein